MGSSWRYCHVAIRSYSKGGFHGLARTFLTGSLVLFHGLAFCFDGRTHEFTRRWNTMGSHWSKQKNKSAQLASPTFSQHFPTHVSPHYIQLDPTYYVGSSLKTISLLLRMRFQKIIFLCLLSIQEWFIIKSRL
jgi:hypothetical protein